MEYRHTQWGLVAIPVFLLFAVILMPILASDDDLSTLFQVAVVIFMAAVLGVIAHFSRLEVTVSRERVTAAFGLGKPSRSINIEEIAAVRRVRNRWWYGWGIRKTPEGWMYNAWGLDAVELDLVSGTVFRIGTDEPESLLGAVSINLASRDRRASG